MKTYYARQQARTSIRVARGAVAAVIVALALACLQTLAHDDTPRDIAGLTASQRAEVVGRWHETKN